MKAIVRDEYGSPAFLRLEEIPTPPTGRSCGQTRQADAVGRKVTRFRPGDEVFGDILYHRLRGFAEYVCVPEEALRYLGEGHAKGKLVIRVASR